MKRYIDKRDDALLWGIQFSKENLEEIEYFLNKKNVTFEIRKSLGGNIEIGIVGNRSHKKNYLKETDYLMFRDFDFNDDVLYISQELLDKMISNYEEEKALSRITFEDLLNLQYIFDEEVAKPRESGFIPRKRTLLDIKLSLDDEFQEWLRELPQEHNFKTWKEKEYNRENELIEITDCLFFFLQLFNYEDSAKEHNAGYWFDNFREDIEIGTLDEEILGFKEGLWSCDVWNTDYGIAFCKWIHICKLRGFTKQDIIKQYLKKYKFNLEKRIKGDWTNDKK